MMKPAEVQSFCQFLMRHRLIAADTMTAILAHYKAGPLGGNKLSILHQESATARSGAIIIVQELASTPRWLKPVFAEPIRLAEIWLTDVSVSLTDSQLKLAIAGTPPPTKRLSDPQSETVVATNARAAQLPAPKPLPARPPSARVEKPPEVDRVKLVRFGQLLVPERFGDFLIEKPLGEGGMGAVFRARNRHTGLRVALKVMREDLPGESTEDVDTGKNQELRERFRREAVAGMTVSSPYVVRAYHLGEDDGIPYQVMELIPGQDLAKHVKTLPADDTTTIIKLVRDTARGVGAFHAKGLIHRDIKPANVMVDTSGCPKLIDSGLVRSVDGPDVAPVRLASSQVEGANVDLTNQALVGTVPFMAPEQALSLPVGFPADVYSLGKVLFLLLTDRSVHEAVGSMAILRLVMQEGPLPPHVSDCIRRRLPFGGMAKRMMAILEKALAFQPADRYANAYEFAEALDILLTWQATRKQQEADAQAQAIEDERKAHEEQQKLTRKLYIGLGIACAFSILLMLLSIFFAKARKEAEARAAAEAQAADSARKTEAEQKLRADVGAQFLNCQALMRACKWGEAETALLALLTNDASYEAGHYALAQVQFNLRKQACCEQWQWLIEHGSESRRSEYAFYAIFYSQQLKPSESDAPYEALLAKINEPRYVGLAKAELAFTRAERASRRVSAPEAITMMEAALALVPAIPESDDLAWLDLAVRGGIKWRISQLATGSDRANKRLEARLILQQSIARNPDFPMTWYWLGDLLRSSGDHVATIAAFERLICLMPNWAPPQYLRMEERMNVSQTINRSDTPEVRASKTQNALQVGIEAVTVCDRLLADTTLDPRQRAMAKATKLHGLSIQFSIYWLQLNQPQKAEEVRPVLNALAQDLIDSADTLADEKAEAQSILDNVAKNR